MESTPKIPSKHSGSSFFKVIFWSPNGGHLSPLKRSLMGPNEVTTWRTWFRNSIVFAQKNGSQITVIYMSRWIWFGGVPPKVVGFQWFSGGSSGGLCVTIEGQDGRSTWRQVVVLMIVFYLYLDPKRGRFDPSLTWAYWMFRLPCH